MAYNPVVDRAVDLLVGTESLAGKDILVLVPDRTRPFPFESILPQVAFIKPAPPKVSQPVAVKKPRAVRPTKANATKAGGATSAGTMTGDGRDGTMDPFK